MSKVSWVSIVGARPQFIKLAPMCRAIEAHNVAGREPRIEHHIVHTGQHYDHDMAGLFFIQLGIPEPQCNLEVRSGSHSEQIARMLTGLEPVLTREKPDWIILYGDTNSTLAGALVGARLRMPLAHVEAGCRSYRKSMPEEQNRIVADHLSKLLLTPTQSAVENLKREGIGEPNDPHHRKVVFVGDLMYDALLGSLADAECRIQQNLERFGLESNRYYLLTLHRSENTEDAKKLLHILQTLRRLELPVLFPMHPRTQRVLDEVGASLNGGNLHVTSPMGFVEMLGVEKHACKILTDSGGVQKEAFYLGVPCVTLREETEWPETVEMGANRIAGTESQRILRAIHEPHPSFETMESPFGDGHASECILTELLSD